MAHHNWIVAEAPVETVRKRKRSQSSVRPYRFVAENFKRRYGFYMCMNPECDTVQEFIEVHHLDGDHNNNEAYNLICLCRDCHTSENNYHGDRLARNDPNRRAKYRAWVASGRIGKC